MRKQDLKYFLVWILPVFGFAGLYFQSYLSPGSFFLAFMVIPFVEFFWKPRPEHIENQFKEIRKTQFIFDALLFLNIPVLFALLFLYFTIISRHSLSFWEYIGSLINMGIILAVHGINVAHELGHRRSFIAKLSAQALLLPSLYTHFTAEHNFWHHKYVATKRDPSSAHLNEPLYSFWIRSITGVYTNAWKLEKNRLAHLGVPLLNWRNRLIVQLLFQFIYLFIIFYFTNILGLITALAIALLSVCLLETINYIEHYGLQRLQSREGNLEPVSEMHSWNSDHPLGRIFLYELTRHPYHHLHAQEKYQNLESLEFAPQLPYGYPASMLMATIPQLWFSIMNKRIPQRVS